MSGGSLLVAIDGGGTKTEGIAFDESGQVLGIESWGPSNPDLVGMGAAVALVAELVESLVLKSDRPLVSIAVYLSGLDFAWQTEAFREGLLALQLAAARHPRLTVDNDIFAVLRVGTDADSAVAVVCGTGINAVGVRADGARIRYPALGSISGDWGGGLDLGRAALWHAARDEDGRGVRTAMTSAVKLNFGVDHLEELMAGIGSGSVAPNALAALSPIVFSCASFGDPVAVGLVERLADEVALFATNTLRRLSLLDEPTPVILGGGILTSGEGLLTDRVERAVLSAAPLAKILFINAPPILGAALLSLGDNDTVVQRRLRAYFRSF